LLLAGEEVFYFRFCSRYANNCLLGKKYRIFLLFRELNIKN